MKDKLSYRQLYDEIETLNTSVFDSLINRDFESFQNTINEFVDSGIMEQDEFATAREAYRYSSMPFTLDGMWISVDSRNPLDKPIMDFSGLPIFELNKRDVQPVYAYLTEQIETKPEDSKLAGKRIDALEEYKELYKNLYKAPSPQRAFSAPLVKDYEKHKMVYINRITELASARSKFYTTFDFTCLPVNGMNIIDNKHLRELDIPEKIKYLTEVFDNLYNPVKNRNRFTINE